MTHPPSDGSEQPAEGGAGGEGMPLNPSAADDFAVVREALTWSNYAWEEQKGIKALSRLQARLARVEEALEAAASQFDYYAEQHDAKTPPDRLKAATNQNMARMCRNALTENPDA